MTLDSAKFFIVIINYFIRNIKMLYTGLDIFYNIIIIIFIKFKKLYDIKSIRVDNSYCICKIIV